MTHGRGARIEDYRAPLLFAWQVTNRCTGRCLHCCEESGPDKAWPGELNREESLDLARQVADMAVPYASFGGGEPLGAPHIWEVFDILAKAGVEIKIETNGLLIGEKEADRLKGLGSPCVQISVDGATAATHEKVRPEGPFAPAVEAIRRLVRRGLHVEFVFVPTRLNLQEIHPAYDLARELGAGAFVTGPMMRLGRAAADYARLAPEPADWSAAAAGLEARSKGNPTRLSMYPWDIIEEVRRRRESPKAMVLVVPDGHVKLLNALPFSAGNVRQKKLAEIWERVPSVWRGAAVQDFSGRLLEDPGLLRHANECWPA